MLTKEERKQLNTSFWNEFKKEMRPIKSSSGKSISWTSYPSDVKDIYIRMEVDSNGARLCIDVQPKDDGIRSILWEQLTELRVVMENEVGEQAEWNENFKTLAGRTVSRLYWENGELNLFKESDRQEIKSFLKKKLLSFDKFYQEYKDILIALAE